MRSAKNWFNEYSESHRNNINEIIHWICIPLIMFSLLGLLWSIPAPYLKAPLPDAIAFLGNWATVFAVFALLFYLRLSFNIFIGMLIVTAIMLFILAFLDNSSTLPLWGISIIIFILAWIGQFIGHKIEGKKPKFLKDLQFLLIGPAWLLSHLLRRFKISY